MSKRLLILCDTFNKPLYVPRITYLCKFLVRRGWDITILTERLEDELFQVPDTTFLAMPYYSGSRGQKRLQWWGDKLWHRKDTCLYRFAKRHVDFSSFDYILCSSFNVFPLKAAAMIATKAQLPLFVDLRDIAEQWGTTSYMVNSNSHTGKIKQWLTRLYIRKNTKQRNKILQQATAVTTISSWHQAWLKQYNPHTYLIYNGYDPDKYAFRPLKTEHFIISYTGRIYDFQFRNPHIFLQAIAELKNQLALSNTNIQIIFHIEEELIEPMISLAKQYQIDDMCSISGYIPREEAMLLLQRSSISLIFTEAAETNRTHGIMTTKFYEALGCEKPILCTPTDGEELAQIICQNHAGIASADIQEIKAFILDKFQEWQQCGYTRQAVINKQQFSREKQAEQFEQLFLQCKR